jgi:hypothetical protein
LGVGADAVTSSFNPSPPEYRLVIARGNDLELQVGAASSSGPTATANVDNIGSAVLFCGGGNTDIAIAEFIAVKGEVTDVVAEQVRTYLIDKYDL